MKAERWESRGSSPTPVLTGIKEATDAVARIAVLQRDLYVLNAELKAIRQAKRLALAVAAFIVFTLMLTLTLGWITVGFYHAGASPWLIALYCFLALGIVGGILAFTAAALGKKEA